MLGEAMKKSRAVGSGILVLCLWLPNPGPCWGEESQTLFQGWEKVAGEALALERGGESPTGAMIGLSNMAADVHENLVVDSPSGDNRVDGGAFAGAGGFSTLIQNTGNHVIIQNSTIVNLSIER
jgi:hypothetical protein